MRTTRLASLALAAALAACGGGGDDGGPSGPSPSANVTVDATAQLTFTPATVTITAGRTVTFRFSSVPHNVLFDALTGAPGSIPAPTSNASVARTFPTAGTYPYECGLHPGMAGTVVVQ